MAAPAGRILPVRFPFVLAQSRMHSIRPRSRAAVDGLVVHIGSKTFMTRDVSTAWTDKLPNTG